MDGLAKVEDFPGLGDAELRAGPAPAANLPAPKLEVLADTTVGQQRTLRLRLVPQRPVRLASLHVETAGAGGAGIEAATVAGRPVKIDQRQPDGRWWGVVFHAPPPEGIEVTLTLEPRGGQVLLRAMDASDGLDGLPGFRPRPADVGVVGSHSSEMLAVARTYPLEPEGGGRCAGRVLWS